MKISYSFFKMCGSMLQFYELNGSVIKRQEKYKGYYGLEH